MIVLDHFYGSCNDIYLIICLLPGLTSVVIFKNIM